ncbi:hypothetical protein B566_EDAN007618 [Ephemera danica]|nr:hypothetical protein B566_EDAN007618 [Ephemera danica]
MAATATEFPPTSYSSSYFLRSVLKEIISKRADKKKTADSKESKPTKSWRKSHHHHQKSSPSSSQGSDAEKSGCMGQGSSSTASSEDEDMNLLQFLALSALELGSPASGLPLRASSSNCHSGWLQLSGHPDSFSIAGPGTVWKRTTTEDGEIRVYQTLNSLKNDSGRDIVPRFFRQVEYRGEIFIELEDLLNGFHDPCVMDVKMGSRTFLESEVSRTAARADLYQKMVRVDPSAPTTEEHAAQAVTKLRYMRFREQQSSTSTLGFRVEAMKMRGCEPVRDLQKMASKTDIQTTVALFLAGRESNRQRMLSRLNVIRVAFQESEFFKYNEVVGSSLLIVRDDRKLGAWVIDFGKARAVEKPLDHRTPWVPGNHEEGFLMGLDSLIEIVTQCDLKVVHSTKLERVLRSLPWR